ncbi:hypothetical protein [Thiothrix lacustris]|uniref:hypothetical protein n=1 Tax=Thiothrix lacustris TaxID=525917 RepID=UPI0027E3E711|nr:hypothetical protein [Thiothrix lacustris]WMP19166.1 hypothetical protein RCS87_08970 [Thiothrix lacustris]
MNIRLGIWGLAGFIGVAQAGDVHVPTREDIAMTAICLIPLVIVLWVVYSAVKPVWSNPWGCLLPLAGLGAFFISFFFLGVWSWIFYALGVSAYPIWIYQRCPQCKAQYAFKPTGVQIMSKDKYESEHQCRRCGYTEWHPTRISHGGGGEGGCGGSGGSGG